MRSLLSSCKRMQSHKPSEEGIHPDCCLSSIHECLCHHIFTLWMYALRLMGLCQRRWSRRLWTDPSPMLVWNSEVLINSYSRLNFGAIAFLGLASFLISGQGCYAALLLLRILPTPGQTWMIWSRHSKAPHPESQ